MYQRLNNKQHIDGIWTWKSNAKNGKVSLYIPYLREIKKLRKDKKNFYYEFHYGIDNETHESDVVLFDLKKVDLVFFYSITKAEISLSFLNDLRKCGVILFLEEVNSHVPYAIFPYDFKSNEDILTKQILMRENKKKKVHIAKKLILERLSNFSLSIPNYPFYKNIEERLNRATSIEEIRTIEALETKEYWSVFFNNELKVDFKRRSENTISEALDGCSRFMETRILRWILFHKFSPSHGFLHLPVSYNSLAFDLLEPYRYLIEKAVLEAALLADSDSKLTELSFSVLKKLLEEPVYIPLTRQYVKRKALLHGIVLSLRSYILGESKTFLIPSEGPNVGGRPTKINFKLPGELLRK